MELEKVCTIKVYKINKIVLSLAGFEPSPYTTVSQGGALPAELFIVWLAMECSSSHGLQRAVTDEGMHVEAINFATCQMASV